MVEDILRGDWRRQPSIFHVAATPQSSAVRHSSRRSPTSTCFGQRRAGGASRHTGAKENGSPAGKVANNVISTSLPRFPLTPSGTIGTSRPKLKNLLFGREAHAQLRIVGGHLDEVFSARRPIGVVDSELRTSGQAGSVATNATFKPAPVRNFMDS